jgi:hypothetical protein
MRCPLCLHSAVDAVECTVCVGKWCVSCHEALTRRLVEMAAADVYAVVLREPCGVSCPFCRHVLDADALHRSKFVDRRVGSAVEAIQQCNYETHSNTMDETETWANSHWHTACIERHIADLKDRIDDTCRGITRFEQELFQLRAQYAAETDRQSRELLRDQLDRVSQELEWEWCTVGHFEGRIDDELASYDAHANVLQLQTNERTAVVSDLFQSLVRVRCTDAQLHTWDELTSPIGFFTFFPQRMQYMHRQLDLSGFVRYLQDWFALRNELLFLVDDVRQSCRQASGTGIRRWLRRHPPKATCGNVDLVNDFNARVRRCVETDSKSPDASKPI